MTDAFSVSLWPDEFRDRWRITPARARLEVYPAESKRATPGPGVLVFPGGGYGMTSLDEGCRVARRLSQRGMTTGVCLYRVSPARYPAPLVDGCRAVRLFRSLAADCGFDRSNLTLLGFSAGGHLAGLVATEPPTRDPVGDSASELSHLPDRLALVYPLVSLLGITHAPSLHNLLGGELDDETRESLSVERRVTRELPHLFIVHAADDVVVPVQHSLDLVSQCVDLGLCPEFHVPHQGGHGFAAELPPGSGFDWFENFVRWLRKPKVMKST